MGKRLDFAYVKEEITSEAFEQSERTRQAFEMRAPATGTLLNLTYRDVP